MSIEFDVYAAAAPNGTKLTTLTDLEVKEFRVSLVDTGEGRLVINRASPQATAANFAQDNVVKVRVTEVSANPIFAFLLQEGNFVAVSTGEEADETLEFGGPGLLQYLDRAIMPDYSTVDQDPGQAGNEGYWPLFAQGPAGGGSAALGSMFMRCINEAFGRSPTPYPNLTVDFSLTNDSNGTAWTSYDGTFRVPIGDSVLTVLRKFQTLGLEAQVTPNLLLRLFEQYGTDRTATVTLEKGVNILTGVERAIHATSEKSHMMVGGDNYTYVYVSTAATIVREGFFGYGTTDSTAALTKAGQIELARRSDDTDKIDVGLLPITADGGYIPGPAGTSGNFWVGDSVKLHTGTSPLDYNMVTRRVSGIRFSEREAGDFDVVVELNGTGTEGSSTAGISATPAVLPPVLPGDQVDCCLEPAPADTGSALTVIQAWTWPTLGAGEPINSPVTAGAVGWNNVGVNSGGGSSGTMSQAPFIDVSTSIKASGRWTATAGTVYRVAMDTRNGNHAVISVRFYNAAVALIGNYTLAAPQPPYPYHNNTEPETHYEGDFTAPTGTVTMELHKAIGTCFFDNVYVWSVGAASADYALPVEQQGTSPYYARSDQKWVATSVLLDDPGGYFTDANADGQVDGEEALQQLGSLYATALAAIPIESTIAPTVTDANYAVGTVWVNTTTETVYILVDNTTGAADWQASGVTDHGALTGLADNDHPQYAPASIVMIIDGGGAAITTGIKGDVRVPFACEIERASLLADQSGSIAVDVWVDTYANYPPTVADTITAAAKPTLSAADKSSDVTLTGWTKTLAEGSTIRVNVDSAATVQRVSLELRVRKT